MAVFSVWGATEMGKSYFVNNKLLKEYKKSIIVDPHHSFSDGKIYESPNDATIEKIFDEFHSKDSYRIILRAARRQSMESLFNKAVSLSSALGRVVKSKGERVVLVIDESGEICSPHYCPDSLQFLVTQGRHDAVDSIFITQDPYLVHGLIRKQSTKVFSFFINGASSMDEYKKKFKEHSSKIEKLPKYHYATWQSNGLVCLVDQKGKIYAKFNEK